MNDYIVIDNGECHDIKAEYFDVSSTGAVFFYSLDKEMLREMIAMFKDPDIVAKIYTGKLEIESKKQ